MRSGLTTLLFCLLALGAVGCRRVSLPWARPTPGPTVPAPTETPPAPAADLVPAAMEIALSQTDCLAEGDRLGVAVWVRNNGLGRAGIFSVQVNDEMVTVAGLEPGERIRLHVPGYRMAPDANSVRVDPDNQIVETDESNNTLSAQLPVPTPPRPCDGQP